MSEPNYIDGSEVHVGDRVDFAGSAGTIVVVAARGEDSSGFPLEQWTDQGNILIRLDDGQLFMHEHVNDEEDITLLARAATSPE